MNNSRLPSIEIAVTDNGTNCNDDDRQLNRFPP